MNILAIIPGRSGSKRIPQKNLKTLGDKPLICWTIEAAQNIPHIKDIIISTDDLEIIKICKNKNVLVPWIRPAELSTDTASSVDVCLHALEWYEQEYGKVDGVMLLQPTSPFRTSKTITEGIAKFIASNKPVIGFSKADNHPYWCFGQDGEYVTPMFGMENLKLRSQDLPPAYVVNGGFYLITPTDLRENYSFYGKEICPLFMDEFESVDIDEPSDWSHAEALLKEGRVCLKK